MMKMAVRKGMALVVATLATMGLWAEGEVTPLMLLNFKFDTTPEVSGWINHFQNGGGTLPSNPGSYTTNGVTFSTTSAGNFYQREKVTTDFQTGTYTDIFGQNHDSIVDEIKASLNLPTLELTENVYKTGLMNGGQSGNMATISGLDSGSKYVVYLGYGLYKSDGPAQQCGFQIESTGYTSVKALEYVATVAGTGTEMTTTYKPFNVGAQIKPGSQGLMVVRLINIVPTSGGELKFKLYGDRSGMNWMAVAKVNTTAVTARVGGTVNWTDITWSDEVTADSMLELTLTENTTLTVDNVESYSSLKVKKDASVEGNVTLKIVAKNGVLNPTLDEGVVFTDIELNAEASNTMKSSALTVPANKTLTIVGTNDADHPLEITGILTVNGTLKTKGQVKITNGDNTLTGSIIATGATMEVVDGTTAMKFNDRGMRGTLTIDAEATLKPIDFVDACNYDGSSTVNVYGTLDMSDSWARWTLRKNNIMNFYTGSMTKGNGQSGTNTGALQFNNSRECVLNFVKTEGSDTVVMDAMVHAENAFTMNVADGVTVTMNNGLGTGKNPVTITGSGTVVMKSAYAFNDAITVNADAMLKFVDNGAVANGVKGEGKVVFSTTTPVFGTVYRSPLNLTLAEGTTSIAVQVTDGEMTEGEVAFKFANAELPAGIEWTVTKAGGTTVNAEVGEKAEDGTVTLTLGVTKYEASTKTSEWNESVTGRVIIQGPTEEAAEGVTLTYDSEIAEAIDEIYFVGKVTIVAAEGQKIPAGRFRFAPGAEVTLANDFYASMTLTNGATLKVRDVTLTKAITVQDGAKLVFGGSVTLGTGGSIATPGQKNSVIEILPAATLKLTADNQIGTNVKVNIYGTLDIGTTTLTYNNNPDQCEYNFYAGSVMTGTTGAFKMAGGFTAKYYVRAYAEAENQYATIDVLRARAAYDRETEIYVDSGVGLKWLKPERTGHTQPVKVIGADVRGLEIQGATNIKFGDNERGLKGDLVIGTGAKLTLTRTDSLEYKSLNNSPVINFDIAGTLDCGAFRQTLSDSGDGHVAGKMVLRDGGQIIGEGGDWRGTKCALDMWKPATIEVVGTATITAPTYSESETSKLTVKPLADNGSGLLVLAQWNANATIDLQPGAQVQLPSTVDASKVVTTARGWMIASKAAAEEGQTVYRTVPKFFTISIR